MPNLLNFCKENATDKENTCTLMALNILESGITIEFTVRVPAGIQMEISENYQYSALRVYFYFHFSLDILENGATEESMVEEQFILQMVTRIPEIGRMLDDMVLACIHIVMVIVMKESGEMMKE